MTLEGQYKHYCCAQRDFNEAYKLVDHYIKDIYRVPKKLVENTAPAIDRYIKEYSFPESGGKNTTSFYAVLDFIEQLDDLTESTMDLFSEHKMHERKRNAYFRKVDELNRKSTGKRVSKYVADFVDLTPELTELHSSLKQIKIRADEMVNKLETLELRWDTLRVNVRA